MIDSICRRRRVALAAAMFMLTGCAAERFAARPATWRGPSEVADAASPEAVRQLPMFAFDGSPAGWNDLIDAVAWADVVIVGEQHDDAIGHAVQRAIVEDTVVRWPSTALSMEMFERDEQPIVDDYLDGIIDAEALAKLTLSENWGAKGMWHDWYQPIVDAARDGGGRVVAASAPRRYVRLASRGGYERLETLPASRSRYFERPLGPATAGYRDRFREVMKNHVRPASDGGGDGGGNGEVDEDEAEVEAPPELTEEQVDRMIRPQLLWDATMADSIARTSRGGAAKVVHLIGQFHADFEGGTVVELRRRLPSARILVISMQRAWEDRLRDEDRGRAGIVIYTGEEDPPPNPD